MKQPGNREFSAAMGNDASGLGAGGVAAAFLVLSLLAAGTFLVSLGLGSVFIPPRSVFLILLGRQVESQTWGPIISQLRMPRAITAVLVGASLGIAGLQMQTLFKNGLADPFILGVSSGAGLGVGFVILSAGVTASGGLLIGTGLEGNVRVVVAASLGALLVLAVMVAVSSWFKNAATVLIIGVAVGAFSRAIVSVLVYFSTPESVQAYSVWTFGSFQGVTSDQIPLFASLIGFGVAVASAGTKNLNAMLLGDEYAASLGVSVLRLRLLTMISTALIAGVVTSFCGPIGFLGLAVPHLARGILKTADHRILVPATALIGASVASICGAFAQLPGQSATLPINAATALFGAPVVVWVLIRSSRGGGGTIV